MSDIGNDPAVMPGFWAARFLGAAAGAGISVLYLLPKSGREATSRFLTGLACGLTFGGPTGVWLSEMLEITEGLSAMEVVLAGSAAASLCAWWALGIMARIAERWARK